MLNTAHPEPLAPNSIKPPPNSHQDGVRRRRTRRTVARMNVLPQYKHHRCARGNGKFAAGRIKFCITGDTLVARTGRNMHRVK
jgi:hypothetical protein